VSTITITWPERDLIIRELLWRLVPDAYGDPLPFSTHDEAEQSIRRMRAGMALRDAIGWGDQPLGDAFEVSIDHLPVQMLRDAATEWAGERDRQIEYRETHILGLRPTRRGTTWADDYLTIDDANASVDDGIEDANANERAIEEIIARIEQQQAVTA